MFKKLFVILVIVLALVFSFVYLKNEKNVDIENNNIETKEDTVSVEIEKKLSSMTIKEKIGQMLIIGLPGKNLDPDTIEMIKDYNVGGFNLLGRNILDESQSRDLISQMQNFANIPLFIATDQEGGDVIRFNFFSELTQQVEIKNTEDAFKISKKRGEELSSIGVNMNFAPVLDYVTDRNSYLYKRTFGTTPEKISELGIEMIKGYESSGVIPVAKHFPGYGNISLDPHKKGVSISISKEDLENNILPFKKVIEKYPYVPIMTAHIVVPIVDDKPATLSEKFLVDILRGELGFKGVIISDDMEMVSVGGNIAENSLKAILSGVDIIISTYSRDIQKQIYERILEAVDNGEISEDRINESVERILRTKWDLILEKGV